jgi:hypothetical protein
MNLSHFKRFRRAIAVTTLLFSLGAFAFPINANAQTAPTGITVQGELKNSAGTPHSNLSLDMRVSFWGDADYDVSTDNSAGSLVGSGHTASSVNITTDASGFFFFNLTDLPASFDAASHRYLQVEAKLAGGADTTYKILDYIASNPLVDRKDAAMMGAFAQTANYAVTAGDAATVNGVDVASYYREAVADAAALAAISDMVAGTIVFQTDTAEVKFYDGTQWNTLGENNAADLAALTVRVTANEEDIATLQSDMTTAQADVVTAQAAADTADAKAVTAQAAAEAAQNTANTAVTSAATAQAAAVAAKAKADANETDIAAAQAAADAADAKAVAAQTDATAAIAAAATAQAAAESAQADATTAIAAAATAQAATVTNAAAIAAVSTNLSTNYYDKTQVDGQISAAISGLQWKASVADFAALDSTYSSPNDGDTALTQDTNSVYTWDGAGNGGAGEWVLVMANFTTPVATTSVSGTVTLAGDRGTGTGVVQGNDGRFTDLANVITKANDNETDIAINANAISIANTNIGTNAGNITNNANAIVTNANSITANGTNITTNTTAITELQTSLTFDQYAFDF